MGSDSQATHIHLLFKHQLREYNANVKHNTPVSNPASTTPSAPTAKEWIGLAVLSTGLGIIVLDGTIVGVALPAIISDLTLNLTDAQWVNSLYAVLLAALLLSTGNLADRWGRKRLFLAGLVVFVAGRRSAHAVRIVALDLPRQPADRGDRVHRRGLHCAGNPR